jgi:hypothetical protein
MKAFAAGITPLWRLRFTGTIIDNLDKEVSMTETSGLSTGNFTINGSVNTNVEEVSKEERDDLLVLYGQAQDWARHYQNSIIQINSLVLTFNSAIVVFIATSYIEKPSLPKPILKTLVIPALLSLTFLVVNYLINKELSGCFDKMVKIEEKLGFYSLKAADKTPYLSERLKSSGKIWWPHIVVWDIANAVVVVVCAITYYYLY